MKTLIAGLGSIGRRHFRNLIALGEKDIILLRTRKATLPDDELAGYPVETDLAKALKRHQPEAVIRVRRRLLRRTSTGMAAMTRRSAMVS